MDTPKTLTDLIDRIEASYQDDHALNYLSENDSWCSISTKKMVETIRCFSVALSDMGIEKGDTIGIMSPSTHCWLMTDLAVTLAGAISVPLFPNAAEKTFQFQVKDANIKHLCIGGEEAWKRYGDKVGQFDKVIAFHDSPTDCPGEHWDDLLKRGLEIDKKEPKLAKAQGQSAKPDDLFTIMYTSGSTGLPKGVELMHKNMVSQALAIREVWPFKPEQDRALSLLPLAHVFGRMQAYAMLYCGVSLFMSDLNFRKRCQEVEPTTVCLVPRILEKVYAHMCVRIEEAGFMKRAIGKWAFEMAGTSSETLFQSWLKPLADRLIYSTMREAFGGRLQYVMSGGAKLDPNLCRFFLDIGVPIYEGYGLTETSPIITCNRPEHNQPGTIGLPLPGVEVSCSRYGEILMRGPNLMRGYHNREDATKEVIDEQGWFHTGDKGWIDRDGHVTYLGRLKEVFKTSTGKFVSPTPIEQKLSRAPLIDLAMVVGESRKFTSALLFPDREVLKALKVQLKQQDLSDEAFIATPHMQKEIGLLVDGVNRDLDEWEQIKKFRIALASVTVDSGELTPTMKLRRSVIAENYKDLIEEMYIAQETDDGN